jgi:hypothetical protein
MIQVEIRSGDELNTDVEVAAVEDGEEAGEIADAVEPEVAIEAEAEFEICGISGVMVVTLRCFIQPLMSLIQRTCRKLGLFKMGPSTITDPTSLQQ